MKKLRKLIILGSATVLTAASLTTSTWAWFKINSTAKVESFDFEVVGGLGFEVSIDGTNYYSDLNTEQIQKAIAVSYDPSIYQIKAYDADGNSAPETLYKLNSSSNEFEALSDEEAEKEVAQVMKNIKLLPATTKDGVNFTDLFNSTYYTTSGRFLEFGVYFKTTSDNTKDNIKYDIYLNGYEGQNKYGDNLVRTIFTSKTTEISLSANMTVALPNADGTKTIQTLQSANGDKITVYSSNAARISTTVSNLTKVVESYTVTTDTDYDSSKTYYILSSENEYEEVTITEFADGVTYYEYIPASEFYAEDASTSVIYEINDTENLNTDLGSYATDYDEVLADGESHTNNYYLYNKDCNAMYTYYNNLRSEDSGLTGRELDYDNLPQNIVRTLPTKDSSSITKAATASEASESAYYPIATLASGEDAKLIKFRVWLEGWDADCFDGLTNAIDVRLAFSSKQTR